MAIATRNRAALLPMAIRSVQAQSVRDLEVVVVDDGSEDDTAAVVARLTAADDRIRYVRQERGGISAARNHAADVARGEWTAVHDDDDLMLPWRLEHQLARVPDGAAAAYGSFVNFDDESGRLVFHHGRHVTTGAVVLTGFAPGHSTWLVRTEVLRALRYDEGLTSAVDNNLALRMLRTGLRWHHTGVMCVLRRVHGGSITNAEGSTQSRGARMSREMVARTMSAQQAHREAGRARFDWGTVPGRNRFEEIVRPYLPDHLTGRSAAYEVVAEEAGPDDITVRDDEGRVTTVFRCRQELSWEELSERHALGGAVLARAHRLDGPEDAPQWGALLAEHVVDGIVAGLAERSDSAHRAVVALVAPADAVVGDLEEAFGGPAVRHDLRGPGTDMVVLVGPPLTPRRATDLVVRGGTPGATVRMVRTGLDDAVQAVRAAAEDRT